MAYKQLEQYEEGTWTPEIEGGTSDPTITYTTQTGKHTRFTDMVVAKLVITINTTSGGSGDLRITLPFTSSNDGVPSYGHLNSGNVNYPASTDYVIAKNDPNTSYCYFPSIISGSSPTNLAISDISSGDVIWFTITYWV